MSQRAKYGEKLHLILHALEGGIQAAEKLGANDDQAMRVGLILALDQAGFSRQEADAAITQIMDSLATQSASTES